MSHTNPVAGSSNWDVTLNAALDEIDTTAEAAQVAADAAQADADTLAAGGGSSVATVETTASLTYVDLATVGPTVEITLAEARTVLVFVKATVFQASTTDDVFMSFTASGATTLAASDARAMRHNGSGTSEAYSSVEVVACNAGTTTFTAKYRTQTAGTGSFGDRVLAVVVT